MTIEEKLEKMILEEFGSIAEFARVTGVNDSTIRSIIRRGIKKAHIDTIFPITKALGINAERLYHGEMVALDEGGRDLTRIVFTFKEKLKERPYRIGNRVVSPDDIEEIIDTLDFVMMRIEKRYK